jgi:uncharacterized protein
MIELKQIGMKDGGIVSLDWNSSNRPECKTLVVILHGLTGGSHEDYVQDLIVELTKSGYNSVVTNFRGCCGKLIAY